MSILTSVDSVAWSKYSAANDSVPDTPKPAPKDDDPDLAQRKTLIGESHNQSVSWHVSSLSTLTILSFIIFECVVFIATSSRNR